MSFRDRREDGDFDLESYVSVNTRLVEFWKRFSEGRIETDFDVIDGRLIMTAKIYKEKGDTQPSSVGHAFLDSLDGDKVGEYTETVAVGRALALLGFQVEKSIASAEEMDRFQKKQAKSEADAREPRESVPEVPRSLKPSRVFKPLDKSKTKQEE
jgi:hypothetical protein